MSRTTMALPDNPHWIESLFRHPADPRVQDWPMMNTPLWPLLIAAAYLYFVTSYGPRLMKSRPAYSCKTFITYYNIYQVLANTTTFFTVLYSGWLTHYSLGCQHVDRSRNPEAMRMANAMWWWFLMKQSELVETILFVLRKKNRQVSVLHIYHHVSTYFIAWIACKFSPGGFVSFSVMPNSFIHVIMYSYYLLSTLDNPAVQKRLAVVKRYLTIAQMVQLTIIVLHSSQALFPSCTAAPKALAYSYVPNVLLVIYLFYNFYRNNYRSQRSPSTSATPAPTPTCEIGAGGDHAKKL